MRRILQRPWLAGLFCLVVILLFHSPRWWLLAHENPGTVEWDRALNYLKQCESPFRTDVEPAMRWRFFPQVLVWLCFGGHRFAALTIPWAGVWVLLGYLFRLARSRGLNESTSAYVTLLVGASAPVLVSTGWLGMNDAWMALGLCYLAFGRNRFGLAAACIVCPFIDERFVFGIPSALAVRHCEQVGVGCERSWLRLIVQIALASVPFVVGRVMAGVLLGKTDMAEGGFLWSSIRGSTSYLWMAPLGIWMAGRFAYLPVLRKLGDMIERDRLAAVWVILTAAFPVIVGVLLASDTMRTAGILLPLWMWATLDLASSDHSRTVRWLTWATLVFPAAYVSYTKIVPINSLPLELWRWLR